MTPNKQTIKKIICFFKRHKRGKTNYKGNKTWHIECERCGYTLEYKSPCARLVGYEMFRGFTGE